MNQNPNFNPYDPRSSDPGQNPHPYGSNPNGDDPYGPTLPSSNPNPNYNPYTPNPIAPPGPNPYDPYTPAAPGPPYNPYTPNPPVPPRRSSGKILLLVGLGGLALLVIVAGIIFGAVVPYQNTLANNAHATATAQAQVQANASATAVAGAYPFSNTVILNDPLADNSQGHKWDESTATNTGSSCQFAGSAYHVIQTKSGFFNTCYAASTPQFTNFTYQVEMTIIKGDAGGILFRADAANLRFYYLRIGQDGSYRFFVYIDSSGSNARTLKSGSITGFNTGLNQTNLIGVVAHNDTLSVYVNKAPVTRVSDSTYSRGQIGVAAEYFNNPTDVAFTNATVWKF